MYELSLDPQQQLEDADDPSDDDAALGPMPSSSGRGGRGGRGRSPARPALEDLKWTKLDPESGRLLTLFQCAISQSNKKWWFLSEADPDAPGTEKDVDYYKHEDREQRFRQGNHPPTHGWLCCAGQGDRGVNPPPTLVVKIGGWQNY